MKTFRFVLISLFLWSMAAHVWAAPVAPDLSYETNGLNLSIYWTQVPDATGYTLYYAPFPYAGPETIDSVPMGTATSFSVDLWDGAAYFIAVTASNNSGESPYSNIEHFVVHETPVLSYETDGLGITLSWTETSNAAGYKLNFASESAPETFSSIDLGNKTSASYYLWEGAAYYLNITSYTTTGAESEPSNTIFFVMGPPTPEWVDDDGDGFIEVDGDCDDTNASINPAAVDVCEDGIDQDCDGEDPICGPDDIDDDGDGYTENQGDCDDTNPDLAPNITDICEDGIDQDCSGADAICVDPNDVDNDGDGYTENQGDCNDEIRAINPGATEICGDGVDQDCQDGDSICLLINPDSGIYNSSLNVSLTSATSGATIYYTTDGNTPSAGSNVYSTPLTVSETQTIKAIAMKDGLQNSALVSGTYTIIIVDGTWAVRMIMGSNSCLQPVGQELTFGTIQIVQNDTSLSVTTPYGSEQGVIQGDSLTFGMSVPYQEGNLNGDISFSMQGSVTEEGQFSGPVTFTFTGDTFRCNGQGTVYGDRL